MIRIALITGGHDFEHAPFIEMFRSFRDIQFTELQYPAATRAFAPATGDEFDTLVFYDFAQNMDEAARANLLAHLKRGKGAVFLHHALYSQAKWPEYLRIVGGLWNAERFNIDGKDYGPSTATMDAVQQIRIADKTHPITQGLRDFEMIEEYYGNYYVAPTVKALIETDHPKSQPQIGWTHTYDQSRVVYLQPGHGPQTYANLNYRVLVERSIQWVCRKI